eukprot:scaffold24180_cov49-Phaeocystis_antarctica.AAC.1
MEIASSCTGMVQGPGVPPLPLAPPAGPPPSPTPLSGWLRGGRCGGVRRRRSGGQAEAGSCMQLASS